MPFDGFPARCPSTPVPSPFFGPLLEEIDNLAELKTALRIVHLLYQKKGPVRYVTLGELAGDLPLARALHRCSTPLEQALEACVRRGVLVAVEVEQKGRRERVFFLNTPHGRSEAQRIAEGAVAVEASHPPPVKTPVEPPNIYRLYEANIGALTPMVAELLKDAEQTYSPAWIAEAIQEAVRYNRRSWGYVEAILRRWASEGKGAHGATGRHTPKSRAPSRREQRERGFPI